MRLLSQQLQQQVMVYANLRKIRQQHLKIAPSFAEMVFVKSEKTMSAVLQTVSQQPVAMEHASWSAERHVQPAMLTAVLAAETERVNVISVKQLSPAHRIALEAEAEAAF